MQRVVGGQYGRKGSLSARVVGVGPRVGRNLVLVGTCQGGYQQLAPDGQKLAGPAGDPLFLLSSSCPFSTPSNLSFISTLSTKPSYITTRTYFYLNIELASDGVLPFSCYNLVYDTRGGKSYRMEYTGYMGVNNLGNKIKNKIILKRFDGKEEDRYDFFYGCIFLLNVSKNILI